MTIDEAIRHAEEVAEEQEKSCEVFGSLKNHHPNSYERLTAENYEKKCADCAADHRQLAEWLRELKEAKRLLKLAVEDFEKSLGAAYTCPYCEYERRKREMCAKRGMQYCEGICKWRYADEVMKLIGDESDA